MAPLIPYSPEATSAATGERRTVGGGILGAITEWFSKKTSITEEAPIPETPAPENAPTPEDKLLNKSPFLENDGEEITRAEVQHRDQLPLGIPGAPTFFGRLDGTVQSTAGPAQPIAGIKLCTRCRFCFYAILRSGWTGLRYGSTNRHGLYHDSFDAIKHAGQAGCQICSIVSLHCPRRVDLSDATRGGTNFSGTFDVTRYNSGSDDTWRLNLLIETTVSQRQQIIWDQSLWLRPTTLDLPRATGNQDHEGSTGSETSINQLRKWIKICDEQHKTCKPDRNVDVFPTRLVDIRPQYERIVITRELERAPNSYIRYATLSHCWGKINMFTLRRDNVAELQMRIPQKQLTKTFREAIDIAKRLGFTFIWIDSLCIIQDDEQDWLHEAALMCDIYGNSSLTIAATGAVDGNGGCYSDRDPAAVSGQPLSVSSQDAGHNRESIGVTRMGTTGALPHYKDGTFYFAATYLGMYRKVCIRKLSRRHASATFYTTLLVPETKE
ncbi:hypothetical protein SCAR479_04506 [Seiridium cardinale]|uniref:Heterokaryon incompatibility domain-containing protein n=1 Tax=Seiridium cardinale TaxID=138064 RepID=A0ABR2XXF8_9PEZI